MISLLDRTKGSTADYIYRRMNASPTGRIRKLERETAALKRYLVSAVRVPRGVELGDDRIEVDFNRGDGRILFHSDDNSVTIERSPYQNPNVVNFEVANPGCENVIYHILGNTGSEISESCTDTLEIKGDTQCDTNILWFAVTKASSVITALGSIIFPPTEDEPDGEPSYFYAPIGNGQGGYECKLVPYYEPPGGT